MNQDNQHGKGSKNGTSSVPTWFQPPSTSSAPTSPPPKKSNRRLVIVGCCVLILTGLLGFVLYSLRSTTCFDANKYEGLLSIIGSVGDDTITVDSIQASESLYIHPVYFQRETSELDAERSPDSTSFLQKISTYYKENQPTAPIAITISTTYLATDSLELAQKRLDYVKTIFIEAGLDASVITSPAPTPTPTSDEDDEDDDVIDGTIPVLVSITPQSTCKVSK